MNSPGLISKFRGCMVGGLLGDCFGDPFENECGSATIRAVIKKFFYKRLSGEEKRTSLYTDDTSMSLSIAQSLVEKRELDPKDIAQKFVAEYFKDAFVTAQRNYGTHVVHVFGALKCEDFKDIFLPASQQFNGSGSYGNGAAMRVAPIALYGNAEDDIFLKNAVEQCSRITHTHPNGYNGAILQCFAVQAALKLDPTKEFDPVNFINQLENKMKIIEQGDHPPYCESLKKIKVYLQRREDVPVTEIAKDLGNSVTAQRSVPTAIYSFLRGMHPIPEFDCSNPLVRTIYFAISVGGDTDTIASMAGNIAGAYYGVEVIPDVLQNLCEGIHEIIELADKLYSVSYNVQDI